MQRICRLDDIEDGSARGFVLEGNPPLEIFVVRSGDSVHAYVNSCPHIGTPLDFLPDRFLTAARTEILCSTHGARFQLMTGMCTPRTCRGKRLARVSAVVENGAIFAGG